MDTLTPIYWGDDRSTRATFVKARVLPSSGSHVTACFVCAFDDDGNVAASKPKRGWGLPGGHVEVGESYDECIRREANEETAIQLGELHITGYWHIEKVFESAFNKKYPAEAFQLLCRAPITRIDEFAPNEEISERAFVTIDALAAMHHDPSAFRELALCIKQQL